MWFKNGKLFLLEKDFLRLSTPILEAKSTKRRFVDPCVPTPTLTPTNRPKLGHFFILAYLFYRFAQKQIVEFPVFNLAE